MKRLTLVLILSWISSNLYAQQVINSSIVDEWPDDRYTVHGDGTVTDTVTKLMWKQCTEGQSGQICDVGVAKTYTWQRALGVPATVNTASTDYTDWRLPNIEELRLLVALDRYNPAINITVFPNTVASTFWSSSPDANDGNNAWMIYFDNGYDFNRNRINRNRVRLVRDTE